MTKFKMMTSLPHCHEFPDNNFGISRGLIQFYNRLLETFWSPLSILGPTSFPFRKEHELLLTANFLSINRFDD